MTTGHLACSPLCAASHGPTGGACECLVRMSGLSLGTWRRQGSSAAFALGPVPRALVILPSALNARRDFIHFAQAFQSWPAVLFLVVGFVLVLHRLGADTGVFSQQTMPFFGVCALVFAACVSALHLRSHPEIC